MVMVNAQMMATGRSLELLDKDAALSLCSMGRLAAREHTNENVAQPSSLNVNLNGPRVEADRLLPPACGQVLPISSAGGPPSGSGPEAPTPRDRVPRRSSSSSSSSERAPRVPFEEMKRLMRVYGPLKCLRNRTPRESGKSTKVLSVKRKFYRWFPDFHERFVLQEGGWYAPAGGHGEEMRYREELRRRDQVALTAKRRARRDGPSGGGVGGELR